MAAIFTLPASARRWAFCKGSAPSRILGKRGHGLRWIGQNTSTFNGLIQNGNGVVSLYKISAPAF